MATTQTEARTKAQAPKNTRRNEIIAILLFAFGVLLALCLFSYKPNDPSWNVAATQGSTRNWIGPLGANVSAMLFQFIGVASYLLPLLLLASAWRRFRTRRIRAPLSKIIGLVTLLLASAAIFAIFIKGALFDQSVPPGGLAGELIKRVLVSGLSTVGATILLTALAATGLLLATNFSFVRAYEWMGGALGNRFSFFHNIPERFHAWRKARRERAQLRINMRRAAREEREREREVVKLQSEKTGAERVAEFMKESETVSAASAIKRAATASEANVQPTITAPEEVKAVAATASAAPAVTPSVQTVTVTEKPSTARRTVSQGARDTRVSDAAEIEEMVKTASVVWTKVDEKPVAAAAKQSRRSVAAPISDYKMPDLDFLNSPPPHLEYADDEYYAIATRLAEKCKEFNVTGKIEHICPGPVVTTYEFKPDPGVRYSRVTSLVDDLCLALKAESIRIDRLPGKAHVGIEVPSPHRETIHLREVR